MRLIWTASSCRCLATRASAQWLRQRRQHLHEAPGIIYCSHLPRVMCQPSLKSIMSKIHYLSTCACRSFIGPTKKATAIAWMKAAKTGGTVDAEFKTCPSGVFKNCCHEFIISVHPNIVFALCKVNPTRLICVICVGVIIEVCRCQLGEVLMARSPERLCMVQRATQGLQRHWSFQFVFPLVFHSLFPSFLLFDLLFNLLYFIAFLHVQVSDDMDAIRLLDVGSCNNALAGLRDVSHGLKVGRHIACHLSWSLVTFCTHTYIYIYILFIIYTLL